MSLCNDGANTTMLVQPAGYNGNNGNGNGMFGDNGAWWIIILFLFIFCGWGNNGWGNGNRGNGSNGGGVMEGYVLTSDFANLERKLDNVNSGLCDGFYAVAQQFSTLQNGVNQGFSGLNTAILTQGNATNVNILQGFNGVERSVCNLQAQIADCCCKTQTAIENVNYNLATQGCETRNLIQSTACGLQNTMNLNTRDIVDSQRAGTQAILEKLTAQEIAAKDAQIAAQTQQIFGLQLRASQEAQNNYLVQQLRPCPTPAYITCNPWASQAPYGSCGCNAGCNSCGC